MKALSYKSGQMDYLPASVFITSLPFFIVSSVLFNFIFEGLIGKSLNSSF